MFNSLIRMEHCGFSLLKFISRIQANMKIFRVGVNQESIFGWRLNFVWLCFTRRGNFYAIKEIEAVTRGVVWK